jgi:hypothetical protein
MVFSDGREHFVLAIDLSYVEGFVGAGVNELATSARLGKIERDRFVPCLGVASHHCQFILGLLHQVRVRKGDYGVHAVRQDVGVVPEHLLAGVAVHDHHQQACLVGRGEFGARLRRNF